MASCETTVSPIVESTNSSRGRDWGLLILANLLWASSHSVVGFVDRTLGPLATTALPAIATTLMTVYVPEDYDGKAPRPLLVLLHGSGGDQWEIPQAAANLDGRSCFAGLWRKSYRNLPSCYVLRWREGLPATSKSVR